ncbi:MAG TPA: acetylornithine deacetylase [Thermohalobaculum sp.]|nr:acetylornithine deacetylase [Thermohalobaculum sp.]
MTLLDDMRETLSDLIAFPTVSADSNLELIAFAAARLDALGAKTDMTLDPSGTKANLFATIGPDIDGGIVLSGHTDVVPVTGQDWATDPFEAVERDGLIYGRGSCDMKGFIACALALAPRMAAADLRRPVHFALSYDEETGCLGAQVMLKALEASGRRPGICIIGEPTSMRIIEGHKGCCEYTTRFGGLAGHGSAPDLGVSSVEYAVRYASKLLELRAELAARAPVGSRFEPPGTTLQIGGIRGGIAHNVIADNCELAWEMRPVVDADADFVKREIGAYVEDTLLPAMRAVHGAASIETEVIGEVVGFEPMPHSEACDLVAELTGGNTREVVSFGTEAGLFQKLGISTVICGPGAIGQAHKADEFVAVEQLEQCLEMIERLVVKLER